ncbi:MAG: neutral/alkaline non-lysosomal ceramidase N-terminal domain-containing protein [Verrucomicrobiales bacterium]|nr:neutral/alkaline non-lysosomal ceramidase N-terminal domain-containing protein [Verrucomicrobiales bacterium]
MKPNVPFLPVFLCLASMVAAVALTTPAGAQPAFRILNLQPSGGKVLIDHESSPAFYHVLRRLNLETGAETPVDMAPGTQNIGRLQDPNPSPRTGYYRVTRVRAADPLDADNDGIDDLYEFNHPPLSAFDASDAVQISPSSGRTRLEDYLRDESNLGLYPYLVGRGMHDITGPAADGGMMGYASGDQRSAGIHDRQWARAFIAGGRGASDKRVVFVVVDTGQVFHAVTQGVHDRLQADDELKNHYSFANIVLSATHTHGGASGHSHHPLYNYPTGGYAWQTYEAMVHGIFMAIKKAHRNLAPGKILLNSGQLLNANENREPESFKQNVETYHPALKNPFGSDNRDTEMLCLRFEHSNRREIGMFNWFPVHGVSYSLENRLLTGDNKGLASYLFEREKGTFYPGHGRAGESSGFVAGFANSNEGDLTANLWTSTNAWPSGLSAWPTNNENDLLRVTTIGSRQFSKAMELYSGSAGSPKRVFGDVDFRHMYLAITSVVVNPLNLYPYNVPGVGLPPCASCPDRGQPAVPWTTYRGAMGVDFLAGTRDGVGLSGGLIDFLKEITEVFKPLDPVTLDFEARHVPKHVIITTATDAGFGLTWTPQIIPISILRIGSLAILSVPAEFTSMAGSRLRKTVESILGPETHTIIAGLANDYSGYVTTYEEYVHIVPKENALPGQNYEAASTQFGAFTLAAYQTKFAELSQALLNGTPTATEAMPRTQAPEIHGVVIGNPLIASDPLFDLQPLPQARPAEYKGKAGCPDGQFFDLPTGACWSCPPGYNRTVFGIDGAEACEVPGRSEFTGATRHGPAGCGPGQFFDLITGACWSCPDGYNRTVFPIEGNAACERPAQSLFAPAAQHGPEGCGPGQFFDLLAGACWSCPAGYNRTIFPIGDPWACERPATSEFLAPLSAAGSLFNCPAGYEYDIILGRCYRCPDGSGKFIFRSWDDSRGACERVIPAAGSFATRHGELCPPGQFRDLGFCWSCPAEYNRTIFRVDDPRACERVIPASLSAGTRFGGLCPVGQFRDLLTGACWSCPPGFNRTVLPIDSASACEVVIPTVRTHATRFGNFACADRGLDWFLDVGRNECWSCNGWMRNANPVDSFEACTGPAVAFGELVLDPTWVRPETERRYRRGDRMSVSFWGGHPKNVFGTINNRMVDALPSFFEVQQLTGAGWVTLRTDADWDTTFQWERVGVAASKSTVSWDIGVDTPTGTYRVFHQGFSLDSGGSITPYQGVSPVFQVIP